MLINRKWAMPNKWTFSMKPIQELLYKYEVGAGWIDPFSGQNIVTQFENNLQTTGIDAFEYLEKFESKSLNGALFDPPYSLTKVKRCYNHVGIKDWQSKFGNNKNGGFPNVKDEIARVLKDDSLCISFGWNSNGLGKVRCFEIIEVLIIAHGGNRNDTITTVERKIK